MESLIPSRNEIRTVRLLLSTYLLAQATTETILQNIDNGCISWLWAAAVLSYICLWFVEMLVNSCCSQPVAALRVNTETTAAASAVSIQQQPSSGKLPSSSAPPSPQQQLNVGGNRYVNRRYPSSSAMTMFNHPQQQQQQSTFGITI